MYNDNSESVSLTTFELGEI